MSKEQRQRADSREQVNNDKVIVTEWRFPAGAETGWHRHEHDYVVVPLTTGALRLETTEGDKVAELTVGASYYRPAGVEHNVVNINPHEFVFIEIEVKKTADN